MDTAKYMEKVKSMLTSKDEEMRELGLTLLKKMPKMSKIEKVKLYVYTDDEYYLQLAHRELMALPKTVKNANMILDMIQVDIPGSGWRRLEHAFHRYCETKCLIDSYVKDHDGVFLVIREKRKELAELRNNSLKRYIQRI